MRSRRPTRSALAGVATLVAILVAGGCGRSGFPGMDGDPEAVPPGMDDPILGGGAPDGGSSAAPGVDAATLPDGALPPVIPTATSTSNPPPPPTGTTGPPPTRPPPTRPPPTTCVPSEEICNGVDDDCNDQVDDDIAPIPCPDGGERYCVDGSFSACPDRCDVCIPGSERVCFLSYCTFWAKQICAADGRGFGACREDPVPRECRAIAERHKDSRQLEQCCIDNGYCCRDEFDLDGDGSRNDMVGACDEVACR